MRSVWLERRVEKVEGGSKNVFKSQYEWSANRMLMMESRHLPPVGAILGNPDRRVVQQMTSRGSIAQRLFVTLAPEFMNFSPAFLTYLVSSALFFTTEVLALVLSAWYPRSCGWNETVLGSWSLFLGFWNTTLPPYLNVIFLLFLFWIQVRYMQD